MKLTPLWTNLLRCNAGGRRRERLAGAAIAALAFAASGSGVAAPPSVELIIKGGTVYTGDLGPGVVEDVGVTGDKIAFVGDAAQMGATAAQIIDAKGLIVTPGFIDPHVHTLDDLTSGDKETRLNLANLMQGITTNVVGVDGGGAPEVADTMAKAEGLGIGTNVATYVGFGVIRQRILQQQSRAPTPSELDRMKAMVVQGMCEGAIGFSTGLFYAPQSYAKTEEVIALAKEAASRGGIYDSHQRDEGNGGPDSIGIVASVQELLRISREAGMPGHFAHLKDSGVYSWGKSKDIIDLINTARANGQQITADQYPYLASGGSVASILIPRWAQEGGRAATLARLSDGVTAPKIRAEMSQFLAARGGPKNLLVIRSDSPWIGKTLADIASDMKVDPIEAAVRVFRAGDPGMAIFAISEDDVKAYMAQPWVMTGSDGSGGHPRKFGSFAIVYDKYVKADHVLSLGQFVHRSTGLTADSLHLAGRGYLKPGYFADITVFDPATYAPRSTYEKPMLLARGVVDVVVNGKIELSGGAATGVLAGRGIRHTPTAGSCTTTNAATDFTNYGS